MRQLGRCNAFHFGTTVDVAVDHVQRTTVLFNGDERDLNPRLVKVSSILALFLLWDLPREFYPVELQSSLVVVCCHEKRVIYIISVTDEHIVFATTPTVIRCEGGMCKGLLGRNHRSKLSRGLLPRIVILLKTQNELSVSLQVYEGGFAWDRMMGIMEHM